MRIGFLADAHGNPFGLKLCLNTLQAANVDKVYFLGDAVGYFPDAPIVLEILRKTGVSCLMGNHEAMILGFLPLNSKIDSICRLKETRQRLGRLDMREISSWPKKTELDVSGKRIACMHGQPNAPLTGYLHGDGLNSLANFDADLLMVAHTHHPFIGQVGRLRVVNSGSAGLPRQGGGVASCAVYDSDTDHAWLLRVPLPIEKLTQHYKNSIHDQVRETLKR